jgi:AraC family transcriptional regulator, transcriptional activator FtrA
MAPGWAIGTREHAVAILVQPGVVTVDLAVPLQVFGPWPRYFTVEQPDLVNPYAVEMVAAEPDPLVGGALHVADVQPLARLAEAATIVVPGLHAPLEPVNNEVCSALAEAAARGARIVSICVGAFVLAAAGVLDGRRATTHWHWADELRRRYSRVDVQEQHLFIDDGQVLTSAGLLAGADLCLHVIRNDLGDRAANSVARFLVSPPHRDGGQALFIHSPAGSNGGFLEDTRAWLRQTLDEDHSLRSIAQHARISVRTLSRRFQLETGETVMGWLVRERVLRARELLENTDRPVAVIAQQSGFGSLESLRTHFVQNVGTSPLAYRRTFRPPPGSRALPRNVRSGARA